MRRFPEGKAEYQDVLNALAKEDRPKEADWLMDRAGPDKQAVIEVDAISDCKNFFAAGSLVVKTSVTIAKRLRAGTDIIVRDSIMVGWGIMAGGTIEAGTDIKVGYDIVTGGGLVAEEDIVVGRGIAARGDIKAGGGIVVGWGILAGRGIKAGKIIAAGWNIAAGEGIIAGESIEAGDGFCIFAGLRLRLVEWPLRARVIAKAKPDNLISGSWVEPAAYGALITSIGQTQCRKPSGGQH